MSISQQPKVKSFETRLFINGKFVEASDGGTFDLSSPATGEKFASVSEATEADTNAAVAAAKAAFPAWSALAPSDRGTYFKKLAQLIRESHDELAELEALSMGRPVSMYFESFVTAESLEHYAETGYDAQGTTSLNTPGFVNITMRQPYGVVGAIIPWNVPILFLIGKCAPALITGNTVIVKSSEKAPLTSAKIATLVEKAGFPPGVINIIHGHGQVSGNVMSHHMDIRVISFTGSGRTGRLIQAAAAKSNLKNVILELGGKSPAIIFPDANIEKAVEQTKSSIHFNSGQVCMANTRIYVHESIAQKFIELFQKSFAQVNSGDPLLPTTTHGPQADEIQYKQIQSYIEEAKKVGKLALGAEPSDGKNGFFISPTLFLETPENARPMKEEIFGPVVHINTFRDEDEVVAKANDTEYGLYAAVYTKDISRALRMAKKLESGSVGVNCTSPTTAKDMPFGGYKASGIGREGWTVSLDNYLETKTVLISIDDE
ncbi:Retinal dehydrogenase 1 [Penicillium argentinense]|uniref:aldehyde dehydrogenase (NAD(+)) n=1 Tax=Penicillium argentinense TaxID=1131581 RepID=A0A9W9G2T1_9EURO|nr:Retinal dehydrogenase 1 [Penicillium argentinense]KAJ5111070.1 Retinal dehydrogenase 1 [Penicillium argentinense]